MSSRGRAEEPIPQQFAARIKKLSEELAVDQVELNSPRPASAEAEMGEGRALLVQVIHAVQRLGEAVDKQGQS